MAGASPGLVGGLKLPRSDADTDESDSARKDEKRMSENRGLLRTGLGMVEHNKRYIFWFWLLNLTLAEFGLSAFRTSAHAILDHSLRAGAAVHGFDAGVLIEMLLRPEFGTLAEARGPALFFAFLFFLATALFLPGVFAGYASTYRLPREDFFRACGRNLWRFIRLMIAACIVMGIATGALFGLHGVLERKAAESTNELLLPEVRFVGLLVIFLIMTVLRIWFDLAEVDIVLNDQPAVRKSIGAAFLQTLHSIVRLLASYVVTGIVCAIILLLGILGWRKLVPPESVWGAFVVSQILLFLLLIPRFWQRGMAVAYWQRRMMVPVVAAQPIEPRPVPMAVVSDGVPVLPEAAPTTPAQ